MRIGHMEEGASELLFCIILYKGKWIKYIDITLLSFILKHQQVKTVNTHGNYTYLNIILPSYIMLWYAGKKVRRRESFNSYFQIKGNL